MTNGHRYTRRWPYGPPQRGGLTLALAEEALAKTPLFAGLSKRRLRQIARAARMPTYRQGRVIVAEGTDGSALFVLLEGSVRVERGNRRLAKLSEGDFFGEISLLDGGPRTASVIAETPTRCLKLDGAEFRRILSRDPQLAVSILSVVARRLRQKERPLVG